MVVKMTTEQQGESTESARPPLSAAATLKVRWLESIDEIPPGLFDACFHGPLEASWWYASLEKGKLEDQFQFAYAVVYRGEEPLAVAPTFMARVPMDLVAPDFIAAIFRFGGKFIRDLDVQKTLFVGSVCSDEGTVGTLPGVDLHYVLPAIRQAVEQRGRQMKVQVIAWKEFTGHSLPAMDQHLYLQGYFKLPGYPGAVVPLPSGNFENYLTTLKSSKRYHLKRKIKRSKKQGHLDASVVQNPDKNTLEEIFGLFWQTYEKGKTKFERLNPEFFRQIAAAEKSHFVLLRHPESGRLVAFMLCFALGKRVINKFIGLDYKLGGEWFLYFRLWEEAVSWAMSQGAVELQSGQTGYSAKLAVGHKLIPLTSYCKNLNPLMHKIYGYLSRTVSWATLDDDLAVYLQAHPDEYTTAQLRSPGCLTKPSGTN